VRTLTETLLVVLDPKGTIRRVEVLSFNEPESTSPAPHGSSSSKGEVSTTSSR
jgi:hypothetical protein